MELVDVIKRNRDRNKGSKTNRCFFDKMNKFLKFLVLKMLAEFEKLKISDSKKKKKMVIDATMDDLKKIDKTLISSGVTNISHKQETKQDTKITIEPAKPKSIYQLDSSKANFIVVGQQTSAKQKCAWDGCDIDEKCQFPNGINVIIGKKTSYAVNKSVFNDVVTDVRTPISSKEVEKHTCLVKGCNKYANYKTKLCSIHFLSNKKKTVEKINNEKKTNVENTSYPTSIEINQGYLASTCKVCSLNCMAAFLIYERSNHIYKNGHFYIKDLHKDLIGHNLKKTEYDIIPAPSKYIIDVYGGNKTIDEYRSEFGNVVIKNLNQVYKCITVVPQLFSIAIKN